jgi:hypothetical protein
MLIIEGDIHNKRNMEVIIGVIRSIFKKYWLPSLNVTIAKVMMKAR